MKINKLDYTIPKLYLDNLVWPTTNHRQYAQMFEHYRRSATINRDAISWCDYLKGNKN